MERLFIVILVMVVVESTWAVLCAVTGVNLFLYFAGLIAASVVFWVPGLTGQRDKLRKAMK
jgi:amino acid permease